MNIFIKRSVLFAIPIIIAAVLMELLLRSIPNTYDIKNSLLEENASNIEIVLCGTSHTFGGIDPTQFDKFTVNIANDSQSLYYDIMILEKYLDQLTSLKMVVFEINFFSLYYNLDKGIESWRNIFYYQTFDIKPQTASLNFLDKIRLFNLTSSEITLLFKNYKLNQKYKANYGFAKNEILPKQINESTAKHKYDQFSNKFVNSAPEDLLGRLRKTLVRLSDKNIKIVFVQIPVSKQLCYFLQDPNTINKFDRLDQYIIEFQIKNLTYLCDQRFNDSLFVDTDHLSYEGAKLLTSFLINDLKIKPFLESKKNN